MRGILRTHVRVFGVILGASLSLSAQANLIVGSTVNVGSAVRPSSNVEIYWTDHGVPHIEAKDWYSLGFGSAYAVASQNVCILADQILKIRSERSLYFGEGAGSSNIISDVGTKALGYIADGKALYRQLTPRAQELVAGYAAGYNKYLSERTVDQLPRPCRGAAWVRPTTKFEMLAYYLSLAERASGQVLMPASVNAAPPATESNKAAKKKEKIAMISPLKVSIPHMDTVRLGSNAWAIGKEMSESKGGLLIGNPHFPGYGALRFYQYRQRIAGVYDVQGVSLIGTPCIQIGFNDDLGWTHTVSKSRHFNFYSLELNPQNPLEYRYGNEFRPITSKNIEIQLLLPTGEVVPYSRPVYFSHYGPMIATPDLVWSPTSAYTYRDANKRNVYFIDQWLDMGASSNLTQFKKAFEKYRGTPWVNTLYADKTGNAFFIEGTPVPRMSQEALQAWKNNPMYQAIYAAMGAFMFDGSNPRDEWQGRNAGLIPYSEAPQLLRKDYVSNHNDTHWVINPNAKLTGFSPLYGPEETPLSYRTRGGLQMLQDMSGENRKFSLREIETATFSNRAYLWENIGTELRARCGAWDDAAISNACTSMANWNGRYDLDSRGFPAFREVASMWAGKFHRVAFDVNNPMTTPSGVTEDPALLTELRDLFTRVAQNLSAAAIDLNATVAELQYFRIPDFNGGTRERVPYHGGQHEEGVFNVQDWDGSQDMTTYAYPQIANEDIINKKSMLTREGWSINGGSSFILFAEFTNRGPRARGILSYSQSSDPDSPYFADQNQLYSRKEMRDFVHDWRTVEANYASTRQTLRTN